MRSCGKGMARNRRGKVSTNHHTRNNSPAARTFASSDTLAKYLWGATHIEVKESDV